MKNARALRLVLAVVLLPMTAGAAFARQGAGDDWCRDEHWGRDRNGVCEVRQFTVAATAGALSISGTNGGISVTGESRGDVHILAKVVATAESEARAREIASAVRLAPTLDRVEAEGPRGLQNREGWSVSYRVTAPRVLNLSLRTSNGGISIEDMDSKIEFTTTNGGVKLIGLAGDVRGRTTNGGVDIDLDGQSWNGEGLDVETTNGGIRLAVPDNYSARLEAHTDNGGMRVDVPGAVQSSRRDRDISVQLGGGGAPLKVRTSNGGVNVRRK